MYEGMTGSIQSNDKFEKALATRAPGGVETAYSELRDQIDRASSLATTLEKRLDAVVRPDEPSPVNPNDVLKSLHSRSDLAGRIFGSADALRGHLNRIDGLLNRIDL